MNRKIIIPSLIVTCDSNRNVLTNHFIEIENNKIISIQPFNNNYIDEFKGEVVNCPGLTVIPGFIQTHTHICQTLFRGLADDLPLLDWLQQKIFPFENAHNKNSLKISAQLGINELLKGGTTTILDMGTLNYQEVIFEELINSGMRAFAGKCMMDINDLFPSFKSSAKNEIKETRKLAEEFHNSSNGKIKYGFAPRFVLSCSDELLRDTKEMMGDFKDSIYHTHSSENKEEVAEVRKQRKKENIEYFNSIDVLGDHTVLAHCIHLNDLEINDLKITGTRVAHCPSSNLKLASGIANIPRYLKEGISVSLGADGAPCNNNLSAFREMRFAALIQKPIHGAEAMDAETVFWLATIEGAKALHIDNEVGSIEAGKKADLVFLDLHKPNLPLLIDKNNVYSSIVYSASQADVKNVMIDGEWIVRNGESLLFNDSELLSTGNKELKALMERVDN